MTDQLRRKRGRPKLDPQDEAASVNVHWRLSAKEHQQLVEQAQRERIAVVTLVRRSLNDDQRKAPTSKP
jgi:hypothetical protein